MFKYKFVQAEIHKSCKEKTEYMVTMLIIK